MHAVLFSACERCAALVHVCSPHVSLHGVTRWKQTDARPETPKKWASYTVRAESDGLFVRAEIGDTVRGTQGHHLQDRIVKLWFAFSPAVNAVHKTVVSRGHASTQQTGGQACSTEAEEWICIGSCSKVLAA
eukprot:SAG31_NODE_99_length_25388_cov_12.710507_18_plen_132_part_00